MTKNTKAFLWTFAAVLVGIWIYGKWSVAKKTGGTLTFGPLKITPAATNVTESGPFVGPDIDPQTGAYLGPGAKPGTVGFSSEGVSQ